MARLYTNENFPFPAVEELRRLGHDVITIQETGKGGQAMPNEAVLEFACSERRTLLTLNRKHFIRMHAQKPEHYGIVTCTFDPDFVNFARRIHALIDSIEDLSGQLLRVNRPNQ